MGGTGRGGEDVLAANVLGALNFSDFAAVDGGDETEFLGDQVHELFVVFYVCGADEDAIRGDVLYLELLDLDCVEIFDIGLDSEDWHADPTQPKGRTEQSIIELDPTAGDSLQSVAMLSFLDGDVR